MAIIEDGKCEHYAQFMTSLDSIRFEVMYWALFIVVIGLLFLASWIFQWAMVYRDKPGADEARVERRIKIACLSTILCFLGAGAILVIEVFCLLALQFCDGEDLMSLYWATWTMLQLGAEIAILGILLALMHHLYNIRHPMWALALGTPVLVVAGFGHMIYLSLEAAHKKLRARRDSRRLSQMGKSTATSAVTSIIADSEKQSRRPSVMEDENNSLLLMIDVGESAGIVSKWPSCVEINDGKAVIQGYIQKQPLPGSSNPGLGPSRSRSAS